MFETNEAFFDEDKNISKINIEDAKKMEQELLDSIKETYPKGVTIADVKRIYKEEIVDVYDNPLNKWAVMTDKAAEWVLAHAKDGSDESIEDACYMWLNALDSVKA